MAIRDFKKYLYKIGTQYTTMKTDLADFEEALKEGFITEDRLKDLKEEVGFLEANYQRLLYVAYLLEIPRQKSKQAKHKQNNKQLINYFDNIKASEDYVYAENESLLTEIRAEIKKLKEEK